MSMIQRILCPIDFSARSTRAVCYAIDLARWMQAEVILLHAFDLPATLDVAGQTNPMDPALKAELLDFPIPKSDVKVTRVLHAGHAGEVVCWVAQERQCDLIVIGTHGRTGLIRTLLGSTAEHVMRHARCPVLTVRERPENEPPLLEPLVLPLNAPRFM